MKRVTICNGILAGIGFRKFVRVAVNHFRDLGPDRTDRLDLAAWRYLRRRKKNSGNRGCGGPVAEYLHPVLAVGSFPCGAVGAIAERRQ